MQSNWPWGAGTSVQVAMEKDMGYFYTTSEKSRREKCKEEVFF
jgi:hypothetical protein